VSSFDTDSVLRFHGTTGAFLGTFATGGGLDAPSGLAFGPDGNLYVSGFVSNNVVRYNGLTGAAIGVFASGGGLEGTTYLIFTPEPATLSPLALLAALLPRRRGARHTHARVVA
jgi:hypothetical protein